MTGTVSVLGSAVPRNHRDGREVVAVLERELGAADALRRIGLPLGEAQVAREQPVADRVLLDLDLTELVAAAGRERDVDVGGPRLGVDDELVPLELCVDVATLLCAAQQLELEALIGGVLEPGTGLDRAVVDDRAQCRVVLTLPR